MIYSIIDTPFTVNECFEDDYNNWNKKDRNGSFLLGEASDALISSGLLNQKIYIDKSKLLKIKNKHPEMSEDIIKKIPHILNNPVIVFKSQTRENRIVVFSEICDTLNKPVLVAMELNPYENANNVEKIYKVASAYGRKNVHHIQSWLNNKDNILYFDNKKNRINKWLSGLGLHLPVPLNNIDSSNEIISHNKIKDNILIKDIPENERPRERAIKYGIEKLSNEELLSIILKTGTKNKNVKVLASNILSELNNINDLKNVTLNRLIKIDGIGKVKAIELLASLEIGKRVYYMTQNKKIKLNSSKKIFEYFKDLFTYENQENFYAVYLDTKSNLISYKLLFKGTINSSTVHPREIFKYAFLESAYSIVVIHNHPTGDSTPSIQDEEVTNSLFKIGKIVAIPVVDHIIIGKNEFFSFYEYINNKINNI